MLAYIKLITIRKRYGRMVVKVKVWSLMVLHYFAIWSRISVDFDQTVIDNFAGKKRRTGGWICFLVR